MADKKYSYNKTEIIRTIDIILEFNFPYLNNVFNDVLFESLELKPFLNIKNPKDIKISPINLLVL